MERNEIRERLRAVMADVFETTPEALPADADTDRVEKWDSLGHLMLIESVEEAFGISFAHDETLAVLSEDALLAAVARHLETTPALATV
jgi:acyl carrier protein